MKRSYMGSGENYGEVKGSRLKRPRDESWERMGYSTLCIFPPHFIIIFLLAFAIDSSLLLNTCCYCPFHY